MHWAHHELRLQSCKYFVVSILGMFHLKCNHGWRASALQKASNQPTHLRRNCAKSEHAVSKLKWIDCKKNGVRPCKKAELGATFETWITPFFSVTSIALDFRIAFKNFPICLWDLVANSGVACSSKQKEKLRIAWASATFLHPKLFLLACKDLYIKLIFADVFMCTFLSLCSPIFPHLARRLWYLMSLTSLTQICIF